MYGYAACKYKLARFTWIKQAKDCLSYLQRQVVQVDSRITNEGYNLGMVKGKGVAPIIGGVIRDLIRWSQFPCVHKQTHLHNTNPGAEYVIAYFWSARSARIPSCIPSSTCATMMRLDIWCSRKYSSLYGHVKSQVVMELKLFMCFQCSLKQRWCQVLERC